MDFKRIEIIFLCAFLGLNLFLLFSFQQGRDTTNTGVDLNSVADIETRLKYDKITTEKDVFSDEIVEGYYLSATTTDFKKEMKNDSTQDSQRFVRTQDVVYEEPIKAKQLEKDLTRFKDGNKQLYKGKDYQFFNRPASDNSNMVFSQVFEKIPFYDETSELNIELAKMTKEELVIETFTQSHLREIEPLREKQSVISEREAIETLYMSNRIPSESAITDTQLAYTRIFTVRGKNVYIPAWFVWIESSKKNVRVERVNAFSNSVIAPNVPEMKK